MTAQGFLGELWITMGVDSSGLANATVAIKNMQNATVSAANGANNALNSTGNTAKNLGNTINSLSNNFYRFGTFATMAFTLPLAALATLGTKSAMELEQIKQKTVALANVSQTQMDAWSGAITRIGIATNATSKSIAEALYFVSSAGVDNANAMKMVEAAAKGTAAGLGETDVIAKLLTYTYNAYGKEAFDVVKIMDSLTVAVREGAAEAGDITSVLGDLIPIGAQLGVSFEQLAGSIAAMTQVGLNAHKAATGLRQIMVQLIKPHHDAADALDKAAIKMNDASIASRNLTATINNKGLLETLVKIKEAGEKMGPMFLPTVFSNVRAFNAFMAEVGPNIDKVRVIMKKTAEETGAFENALSIMTQTSEFKLGQFKKAWELAMLGLGQSILPTLLPMLHSLTQTINDLSNWFRSLSSSTQGLILDFGIFLALLGPITIALSGLIRLWAILGIAMTGMIIPAVHALGTAFVWLSGIMLANPYIAITAAIVMLGVAIYGIATKTRELSAAQKVLNDVNIQASQSIVAEKVAIDQLMRVATNENATKDQKAKAIKTINQINPEYLEGINQETIRTGEATAAIGRYLTMLTLKAKKEAAYAALVEVEKQRAMALATGSDRELSFPQKVVAGFSKEAFEQASSGKYVKNLTAERIATENANKATKDYQETVQKLSDVFNEIPLELQRVEQASVKVAKVLFPTGNKNLFTNNFTKENAEIIAGYTDRYNKAKEWYDLLIDVAPVKKATASAFGMNWDKSIADEINDARKQMEALYKEQQKVLNDAENSPIIYMTSAKYIEDMVGGMSKYNYLVNNSKPKKAKDNEPPEPDLKDPFTIYQNKLAEILIKQKLFGNELKGVFDVVSETSSAKKTYLDSLIEKGESGTGRVKELSKAIIDLQKLMDIPENMDIKFNDLTAKDFVDTLAPVKDMFDSMLAQQKIINEYNTAIDKNDTRQVSTRRNSSGWKTDTDNFRAYIQQLKDLRDLSYFTGDTDIGVAYQLKIDKLMKPFENMTKFQKFNEKFQQIGQQMTSMISNYVSMIDQQQTKAISFMEKTATAEGKSAEQIAKQKADIDEKYGRKKKQMAIAEAVINGALAITNIWAHTADVTGVFWKLALSGLSAANTAMQIGVISGAQMAEGGIVPSGYNNDTYPALLSSGETVVPPHKLPNMLGAGKQSIVLKGEFVVRGKDLVYVFQQEGKLMQSY